MSHVYSIDIDSLSVGELQAGVRNAAAEHIQLLVPRGRKADQQRTARVPKL